jgi:hypothetical protein
MLIPTVLTAAVTALAFLSFTGLAAGHKQPYCSHNNQISSGWKMVYIGYQDKPHRHWYRHYTKSCNAADNCWWVFRHNRVRYCPRWGH